MKIKILQKYEISIEFSFKEFHSFMVSGKKRCRLIPDFEEALNIRLQENGFNQWFSSMLL